MLIEILMHFETEINEQTLCIFYIKSNLVLGFSFRNEKFVSLLIIFAEIRFATDLFIQTPPKIVIKRCLKIYIIFI